MDNANGSAPKMQSGEPPLARRTVTSAMEAALGPGMAHGPLASVSPLKPGVLHEPEILYAPYHVHGSVLEGGDSPAVLAQPAAARAEHQGSQFHPARPSARRAKDVLADAQDVLASHYRQMSEGAEDYVRGNPWKSVALAALGGLIVGLLATR